MCFLVPFTVASGLLLEGTQGSAMASYHSAWVQRGRQLGGLWPPVIRLQVAFCLSGHCLQEGFPSPCSPPVPSLQLGLWRLRGMAVERDTPQLSNPRGLP